MSEEPTPEEFDSSLITFAEEILGLSLYDWQVDAIEPFDHASEQLVQVTLATPNGSGKSAVVIPTLVLGWLALYPRGKVVVTTADGKQLDGQVMPAIEAHRSKFPDWKFIEREITTPSGGRFVAFTTDQAGRAEGWHKIDDLDGPLLIIADEAKTIPDDIFSAIDRCTYNALLLTSSPGKMSGRFYDSHFKDGLDFIRIRVGLKDCPHITQDKIDRIIAQHGADSPFTRSTLEGQFMEAEGEARFDRDGLARITTMATAHDRDWREKAKEQPSLSVIGELTMQEDSKAITWTPDAETGWLWKVEDPTPGCAYLGFCDPMTGEQSEGSKERDTHAAGILRLSYLDETGHVPVLHNDEIVAVLHHPGGCRWDNDILADRLAILLKWFKCPAIVEANNSGTEIMRLLQLAGCSLWRRQKRDHKTPGKLLDIVGFQTNGATKSLWVGSLVKAIREQTLDCLYPPAASQFSTFILNDKGTGEAQDGCHDDYCTGVGMALHARNAAVKYRASALPILRPAMGNQTRGAWA